MVHVIIDISFIYLIWVLKLNLENPKPSSWTLIIPITGVESAIVVRDSVVLFSIFRPYPPEGQTGAFDVHSVYRAF